MSSQPHVPPGQRVVQGFPVLHYSSVPRIDLATWRLRAFGLVEEPLTLSWEEFRALPAVSLRADFHCVTRWSRLDNLWEGVSFRELAARARPEAEACYVMVHCYDGFTTNVPPGRPPGLPPRRGRAGPGAWLAPAPGGAQALRPEERQVRGRVGVPGPGPARLLGGAGLP